MDEIGKDQIITRKMKGEELRALIDKIRKRHNRRVFFAVLILLVVFWGGFGLAPSPHSDVIIKRQLYNKILLSVCFFIAVVCGFTILHFVKSDCFKLGVLCPNCGLHLYSRRRLLFGGAGTIETEECPHCHYKLVF
jgi:hypothetical protein